MKKLSTPYVSDTNKKRKGRGVLMPRRQTIAFLTQFARAYHVEPVLHSEFCGLVLN